MRRTAQETRERHIRIKAAIAQCGGTLHFVRSFGNPSDKPRWIILAITLDFKAAKDQPLPISVENISQTVAAGLGFRFDERRRSLVGESFASGAEDVREAIREQLDLPNFFPTIIS